MVCGLFSHIKNICVKNNAYKIIFSARQQDRDNLWLSVETSTMRGVVMIMFLNVQLFMVNEYHHNCNHHHGDNQDNLDTYQLYT